MPEADKPHHVIRSLTAGQLAATSQSNLLFTNYVIAGYIIGIKLTVSLMAASETIWPPIDRVTTYTHYRPAIDDVNLSF